MEYLIFLLISIAIVLFCFWNMNKCKVLTLSEIKVTASSKENVERKSKKKKLYLMLAAITCLVITYWVQVLIYRNTGLISFIKLCVLYTIVLSAALIDYKLKIIPNYLVLIGLGSRALIYVFEIFFETDIKQILVSDAIGLAIGFGLLSVVSVVTKQALGFGDAKLFAVIGITLGSFGTYSVLFFSIVISALASVGLLIFKKRSRKDSIPFGPCIFTGYLLTLILGSY